MRVGLIYHTLIRQWPKSRNTRKRQYLGVRPVVMRLDVFKIRRIFERRIVPVQIFQPPIDVGIIVLILRIC